jgi:hypothetical protein
MRSTHLGGVIKANQGDDRQISAEFEAVASCKVARGIEVYIDKGPSSQVSALVIEKSTRPPIGCLVWRY